MFDMLHLFFLALEEILIAFRGGDWGYGALAELTGSESTAQDIFDAARLGGERR
jgi:hypothetical protein